MAYKYVVGSELYRAGVTTEECHDDYTAVAYFVLAEAPDGKTYSKGFFPGCESGVYYDPDFGSRNYFKDRREEARAEAEALLNDVESSEEDPTKADGWTFLRNAYGSEAYANDDFYAEYGY